VSGVRIPPAALVGREKTCQSDCLVAVPPARGDPISFMTGSLHTCDALVIGGGIGGVSLAYELAADRTVCLVEAESTLAFHTTGRSAATLIETYGNLPIRALTSAGRKFFTQPLDIFDAPLASLRGVLHVATTGDSDAALQLFDDVRALSPHVVMIDGKDAEKLNPLLRPGYTETAVYEPGALDLDVSELHQGYVRGLLQRGGTIVRSARIVRALRHATSWEVTDENSDRYITALVVNAAGAWCDEVARHFGVEHIGIMPLRRTIFAVPALDETGGQLPWMIDVGRSFYVKPEKFQYLCSPGDETRQSPGDAVPDQLDVARGLDLVNSATIIDAKHVRTSWAGLRSFVSDRTPVVGFDDSVDGFFWMAAQGGYGIQIAPSLAKFAASAIRREPVSSELVKRGFEPSALSPARLRPST
jgi:D-arginine dehydrogenase